ncbi:hypothetical protein [Pseudonocardia sp.]|uniref:hypothetical protein n=1 Tax=Pseudonocardia sp. TaxID=60912 RepID=UPI002627A9C2|nr:hypothetical protein [Pseudonocardia sp.]
MTLPGDAGIAAGGAVLVVVLVLGLLAGWAKQRWVLLLAGLVAVVVVGLVVGGTGGLDLQGPREVVAQRLGAVYEVVVPPAIAFVAGWLAARGTWFKRALVVGVGILLLAAFPYAAAAEATAGWVA